MKEHFEKDLHYHEAIAGEYDSVVVRPREVTNDALFADLMPLVGHGRRMLDLACGTGHAVLRFASRFAEAVAVDHSPAMLAQARRKAAERGLSQVKFIQADVFEYLAGADKESFDLITCVGFLHHVLPQQIGDAVKTIAGLLCPSGLLLVSEPVSTGVHDAPSAIEGWNRRSLAARTRYSVAATEPDEQPLEPDLLRKALRDAGLSIVKTQRNFEIYPHHFPPSLSDVIAIRVLNMIYGRKGNVMTTVSQKGEGTPSAERM